VVVKKKKAALEEDGNSAADLSGEDAGVKPKKSARNKSRGEVAESTEQVPAQKKKAAKTG
jgi:hypothetical protein